ncbi:hypothetical protein Bca4012_096290 [Brassica carinata]
MAEAAILGFLQNNESIPDSGKFAAELNLDHEEIKNVIKSLQGFRYIEAKELKRETLVLTDEGKKYAAEGSPEFHFFSAVPEEGSISKDDLEKKLEASVFKIGSTQAAKKKWVAMGKQVSRKVQHVEDKVKESLLQIQQGLELDQESLNSLKARKLIVTQGWTGYSDVKKGPCYAPKRKIFATDLTRENLQNWKELEFKEYNFNAKGQPLDAGHLHPLLKVRKQFKDIFCQMGFEEMPTNNFVESRELPEDYVERVKQVHESGGYGSRGYNYDWKREEANKNLLRTHTTAVSSRMLYALAKGPFTPKKYFSIDRVFRNEAVDRTHLAEFHQIEGLICDRGLTLGDLIGVLQAFFSRLGMPKLRFKPAYNPYTEPSMEIFSYHEGLEKWVEIGNSGMFRPEMLQPMGLPEDVRVIAWGLSLERPTMILYGIDNIRDLFGHKVDLDLIKRNPICRVGIE